MAWDNSKALLQNNGNEYPPQIWDEENQQYVVDEGNRYQYGYTGSLWVPVKVNSDGQQEVKQSGSNVSKELTTGDTISADGSKDYKIDFISEFNNMPGIIGFYLEADGGSPEVIVFNNAGEAFGLQETGGETENEKFTIFSGEANYPSNYIININFPALRIRITETGGTTDLTNVKLVVYGIVGGGY